MVMTRRQRQALQHPQTYAQRYQSPHKNRVETIGTRLTILVVSEQAPGAWVWRILRARATVGVVGEEDQEGRPDPA